MYLTCTHKFSPLERNPKLNSGFQTQIITEPMGLFCVSRQWNEQRVEFDEACRPTDQL